MTATLTASVPVHLTTSFKPRPDDASLGFGTTFTDHMFMREYEPERGWTNARIEPYHDLRLDPAAAVLHYAQAVFDGLKAFRSSDGTVRLFRPRSHAERLITSAQRMCIPPLEVDDVLNSFASLVSVDRDWVPRAIGTSLYVRPVIVATEPFLGVRPAARYLYYVILSPVGAYYARGLAPARILVTDRYVRAVEGGIGSAKAAANYAASLLAAEDAHRLGFDQVLWLDGVYRRYLDEVGTMNIMLRIGDEVLTPRLSGAILAGVTRDSALTLLRDWGIPVSERPVTIDEVAAAAEDGTLREMWGTGTAASISPVGELGYRGKRLIINGGGIGELTQRLFDGLRGIQYATSPDHYGWMVEV
jgi:branched-chain amino acid aminotransferase